MHNLKLTTAVDKNQIASDKTFLVALQVDVLNNAGAVVETLKLVNNSENVTFEGVEYTAYPFSVELSYETGAQPTITINAMDASQALMSRMQAYGGATGFPVRILVMHEENMNGPAEIIEQFEVTSASASDTNVMWQLGTLNLLQRRFPARRQLRERCSWKYKSVECGYSDWMTGCDYSLNGPAGCVAHGNSINFGGFPGLNNGRLRYF